MDGKHRVEEVEHIIDATGFNFDMRNVDDNLLQQMTHVGLIKPDSDLGGLCIEPQSLQAQPGNSQHRRSVYIAGHLAIGAELLTSGLTFCQNMTKQIVSKIMTFNQDSNIIHDIVHDPQIDEPNLSD